MQRLAPAVRASLAKDAASSTAERKHWSLKALATINGRGGSSAVPQPGPPDKTALRGNVAETLLRDVQLRLAAQHEKCLAMLKQTESSFFCGAVPPAAIGSTSPSSQDKTADVGAGGGRIVRAVNHPVDLSPKETSQNMKAARHDLKKSIQLLRNLEALHADTYKLTHELLCDGAPALKRFSAADRSLVASTFESIRSRHATSVENLADAILGLRRSQRLARGAGNVVRGYECGMDARFVESFLRSRLDVQLLCDHYVALDKGKPTGGISLDCDLKDVVTDATIEAQHLCDGNHGVAPDVPVGFGLEGDLVESLLKEVIGGESAGVLNFSSSGQVGINLPLIRPWVHHSLVEVLKNAMASSVQIAEDKSIPPPDVHVRLLDGTDHAAIVILDQGVGLTEESMKNAFRFAESSSLRRWDRIDEQQSYAMVRAPLASLGVGLPLSRMMMRMFGGDVLLSNRPSGRLGDIMLNSGCTAVIRLAKDDSILEEEGASVAENDVDSFRYGSG